MTSDSRHPPAAAMARYQSDGASPGLGQPQPPRRSRRRSPLRALLGLTLGVSLAFATLFTAASVSAAVGLISPTFNILVLGTDQRPDQRGRDPGRTDSMMVVAVSRSGSGVSLVSIPRDLWVPIPGYGEGRISSAYRTGELARSGNGLSLAKRAVGDALGVPIHRVVLVDMRGLRDIVNQLGGIEVDNPQAIVDDAFPTDDYGIMRVTIPAGRQQLDGDLALAYARTRHQDSDFGRMARQQQVMSAILARLRNPLAAPQLPGIIGTVHRATESDLNLADAPTLGLGALNFSIGQVRHLVAAPPLVTPLTGIDGASLLQPSPTLRSAIAAFLSGTS